MKETVIRVNNVTKTYKGRKVIENASININRGEIYGFIGENGAGKTTLLRIISGLAGADKGEINLFGKTESKELTKMRKRIGVMIEAPAIYPYKTAEQNMELNRLVRGIPGKDCIGKALKLVGLEDTGKKLVKSFSLGMKQRLGIAMALMGDPEILLLDEPINGLDPTGIIEIREILKKLNKERGVTILISSHILSELYQMATNYGIIHRGKIIEEISSEELNKRCRKLLNIRVDDASKAAVIISEKLKSDKFEIMPDQVIHLYDFVDEPGKVNSILSKEGIIINEISTVGEELEKYYANRIGGAVNA